MALHGVTALRVLGGLHLSLLGVFGLGGAEKPLKPQIEKFHCQDSSTQSHQEAASLSALPLPALQPVPRHHRGCPHLPHRPPPASPGLLSCSLCSLRPGPRILARSGCGSLRQL